MREIVICEDVEIERNLLNTVLELLFLDTYMKELNGMETAQRIRELGKRSLITD